MHTDLDRTRPHTASPPANAASLPLLGGNDARTDHGAIT